MVSPVCNRQGARFCSGLNIFSHLYGGISTPSLLHLVGSMLELPSQMCKEGSSTMDPSIATWERAEIPPYRFYCRGGEEYFLRLAPSPPLALHRCTPPPCNEDPPCTTTSTLSARQPPLCTRIHTEPPFYRTICSTSDLLCTTARGPTLHGIVPALHATRSARRSARTRPAVHTRPALHEDRSALHQPLVTRTPRPRDISLAATSAPCNPYQLGVAIARAAAKRGR